MNPHEPRIILGPAILLGKPVVEGPHRVGAKRRHVNANSVSSKRNLRMNAMKCRSSGHVVAMVLAVTDIAGFLTPAMGQPQKPETPQAPDQESPQSSPPDTTPYVRPVIPADRMRTPRSSPPDTTPYVRPVIPADRMRTPLPPAPRSETP
jgi:hypothetical protein